MPILADGAHGIGADASGNIYVVGNNSGHWIVRKSTDTGTRGRRSMISARVCHDSNFNQTLPHAIHLLHSLSAWLCQRFIGISS